MAGLGAHWLCEQHPDKVRADFIVNEGGGESIELARPPALHPQRRGEGDLPDEAAGPMAGPATPRVPRIGDNALLKLADYISALSEQPQPEPIAVGEALLEALLGEPFSGEQGIRAGLERLRAEQPLIADFLVEPMLGVTLTPTIAQAGKKANVIPSEAEVLIDCRVPPGYGEEEALAALRGLIGEGDITPSSSARLWSATARHSTRRWRMRSASGSARSTPERASRRSSCRASATATRSAPLSRTLWSTGSARTARSTCSRPSPLIHGADERVPASDVEFSASFFYELPRRMLG